MPDSRHHPPELALIMLRKLLRQDFLEDVLGDLEENFYQKLNEKGLSKARWNYWLQAFRYLRPFILKRHGFKIFNRFTMLNHFFRISIRSLLRHKLFSSIEVGGMAVGIAVCVIISLYIFDQTSYDQHYQHNDRIFRLVNRWSEEGNVGYWSNVHGPLKEVLEDNIPEVERVARVVLWSWGDSGENHVRPINSEYNYFHDGFIYADPELLEILEIPLRYGDRSRALSQPKSMVISAQVAEQFFPGEDPVGKQMILNNNQESVFTIGGVMENTSVRTHLSFDFILTLFERKKGPGTSGWCCTNYNMYVRLKDHADKFQVESKASELRNTFVVERIRETGTSQSLAEEVEHQSYYLQPVGNIFLNPEEAGDILDHGSEALVWSFAAIAGIVLLLACTNFINLATARSLKRAREVGIRKTLGSFRADIIRQYLTESVVYCLLAVAGGILLSWMVLPWFNELGGLSLTIPWLNVQFILLLLIIAIVIGLLSGLYPALYLSRFSPAAILKGYRSTGKGVGSLRGALVIFQFTATIVLLTAAIVTHRQFQFLMNKSLGYEKDQVVIIKGLETMEDHRIIALKNAMVQLPGVMSGTISDFLPVEGSATHNRTYWPSDKRHLDPGAEAARWTVDRDYLRTLKIELRAGRNFHPTEINTNSLIINEKMAETLGMDDPVGEKVIDMFDEDHTVIGVVEDFHFESLFRDVRPLAIVNGYGKGTLLLKINGQQLPSSVESIGSIWKEFNPNQVLRYEFMDQEYSAMYDRLSRIRTIFTIFAVLSIIVACLGLFALSIYIADQRSREISIRKVMGASGRRIFWMLSYDFVKLVILAVILALPIAWYFADYLIADMPHRIDITWQFFAASGLMALLIALGTVSVESIKASLVNPADRLRSE